MAQEMDRTKAGHSPRFTKPVAYFYLFRLNRSIMVAFISGAGAYVSGAGTSISLWLALAGWLTAVGGFSLDLYADRDLDVEGTRSEVRHNPFTDDSLSAVEGITFSTVFLVLSFLLLALVSPWSLILWGVILAVVLGLALHLFETPLARAATLGLLQALYFLMGAAAGTMNNAIWIIAAMFFFAMFAGRGVTDIRDFPEDSQTRVITLSKKYGIRRTSAFAALFLLVAYALSLAAYFTGEFNRTYLYMDIAFITLGSVMAVTFALRPSPRLALFFTVGFMMGLGSLICLAMILGRA